jgi:hypothetical protein
MAMLTRSTICSLVAVRVGLLGLLSWILTVISRSFGVFCVAIGVGIWCCECVSCDAVYRVFGEGDVLAEGLVGPLRRVEVGLEFFDLRLVSALFDVAFHALEN